jgi:hypothetical protein
MGARLGLDAIAPDARDKNHGVPGRLKYGLVLEALFNQSLLFYR